LPGQAAPLQDRERHRFKRVETGKQCIDLECAREPAPHAVLRTQPVMSSPPRRICPALGVNIPVIRLIKVVLPAPFGPINA
jgi:hypothetical protein